MRGTLLQLYSDASAGVLTAMLVGDKDLLPEEVETLYRQNGISHILAISGLHISMLCMGFFRLLRKVRIPLKAATFLTLAFLGFYVVLSGASTSSLRAGIMCLVLLLAKLLRRSYDLLSSLSFAAMCVTFLRPQELSSAGFLLSFGAVLGVATVQSIEKSIEQKMGSALRFGLGIQLVTLPTSLWFYYEFSPYSIFLNLVIIPLATFVLGGAILSLLVGLVSLEIGSFFAGGTHVLLSFYEWLGRVTQKLPYSYVLIGQPKPWQIAVYYLVLFGVVWCTYRMENTQNTPRYRYHPFPMLPFAV